ncbi:ABC transporter permease [Marinicrinis sediminis]|uniref:ABC transporter permease n=1 Tax=Marinicrinis sediminis TaxID=1652465 RepID=A0ABW5RD35_9BACL
MNVFRQLTIRNLKLNRRRTIVTLIGIILSAALITGVSTLIASFQDVFVQSAKQTDGAHHASFYDVKAKQIKYVTEHAFTKTAMLSMDSGFARLEGLKDVNKPYLMIKSYDAEAFAHLPVDIVEGRLPEQAGEIVLSEEVFYSGGVEYQVGDQIDLMVGDRVDEGMTLVQEPLSETEKLAQTEQKTYTITGFIEMPRFERYHSAGFAAVAYLDERALKPDELVNVSIVAKKPKQIFEQVPDIAEAAGVEKVVYNEELLKWMGITKDNEINAMFRTVGLIIILLVVVGSVTVIYNAFAISVSERKRQFGMLASVGATQRQIRQMVFYEGLLLGLIGIPIGILSGIAGIGVTLSVVNQLIADMLADTSAELRLIVSMTTMLQSVGFIGFTIFLSAFIPAKRASRVSPVQAIRQNSDINIKGKKLKTSRLTRWLFGMEGELALKNMKRQRKRYRATVFSLCISIVLYLSFSSFMLYGFESTNMYYTETNYDYEVRKEGLSARDQQAFYQQIIEEDAVERYTFLQQLYLVANEMERESFGPFIQDEMLDSGDMNTDEYFSKQVESGTYKMGIRLVKISPHEYKRYVEELGLNPADDAGADKLNGILVNYNKISYPLVAEYNPLQIEAGETLSLSHYPYENEPEPERFDFQVSHVTEENPFAVPYTDVGTATIIVSDTVFEQAVQRMERQEWKEDAERIGLYLNVNEGMEERTFRNMIRGLDARNHQKPGEFLTIYHAAADQEAAESAKMVISIFLYGFVTLITLIGVTNIFNTISTNVALRRREFAMLKSVGLTPRGFTKMMNYESVFYGLKALMFGIPISILISLWLYNSMGAGFEFDFILPWKEIVYAVIGVFLIVSLTMLYAASKLKKENIIDALKEENL